MAVAIEELTPEAQAVAARLHPAVKEYLERKAGAKAAANADRAAAKTAKASAAQGGQRSSSRGQSGPDPLSQAADFERKLDRITPGRGVSRSTGGRLISAVFIGVLVLEVLSYALGQPFSYSLKAAAGKVGDLSKTPYRPLFAGQVAPSSLAGHGL